MRDKSIGLYKEKVLIFLFFCVKSHMA